MKKRFLVNDDAASLWDELEENESIRILGGTSSISAISENDSLTSATDIDKDNTVTVWSKSF